MATSTEPRGKHILIGIIILILISVLFLWDALERVIS